MDAQTHKRLRILTAAVAGALCTAPALGEDLDRFGVWPLFLEAFDVFTIMLLAGSLVAVAVIVRCFIEIRQRTIAPASALQRLDQPARKGRLDDVRRAAEGGETFYDVVARAALDERERGPAAMREAAEMAASVECAKWFRRIEILNVIGNLGPLVGLAGTVWGMILAFTSLGVSGGQAGPTDLSLGISKALFHTLLGLLLAIPCLLVFGIYRSIVDRICTDAMAESTRLVERLAGAAAKQPTDAE